MFKNNSYKKGLQNIAFNKNAAKVNPLN